MMKYLLRAVVSGTIALTMTATPLLSQSTEQSIQEMAEKFKKQKTRGLAIATPTGDSGSATGASTTAQTSTASAAALVPKEEQVNVNVSFDFDSAALRVDQKPLLVDLCSALKAADVQKIRILGHTDSSGSAEYNQRLSLLRAQEVMRYLATDCGFPEERMESVGVGEEHPFDPADPRADVNRRVEFQALS